MSRLRRILDGPWCYAICGALVCLSVGLSSIQAWQGSKFSVAVLTAVALVWVVISFVNMSGWRRAERWQTATRDGWKESHLLATDYAHLLAEALETLETWDKDTAEDIGQRWRTVSLMRTQNIKERMERDG